MTILTASYKMDCDEVRKTHANLASEIQRAVLERVLDPSASASGELHALGESLLLALPLRHCEVECVRQSSRAIGALQRQRVRNISKADILKPTSFRIQYIGVGYTHTRIRLTLPSL